MATSGAAEPGDRFGASVLWTSGSQDGLVLAAGAPGENVGTKKDAGALVRFGLDRAACSAGRSTCARVWTQSAGEFTGTVAAGNRFGLDDRCGAARRRNLANDRGCAGLRRWSRRAVSVQRNLSTFDTSWFQARPGDRLGSVAPIG